ncbi:MAG: hypothetical protein F9K30_14220 [Dechloromonas sp.]|nr:MAG: hypothetical protein F9K30_14220 [Dechloromonas sp.]
MSTKHMLGTAREALKRWSKLPAKDKNLHTAVAAACLIGLYTLFIWPLAGNRLDKLRYDLEKMSVREKAAAKSSGSKAPAPPPPGLGGKSARDAERELLELQQQLETARGELLAINRRFVPLDDSLAMNALKSGLTSLAETGDMEVTAIEHVYLRDNDKDKPPTAQLIQEAAQANPFKRPLVTLKARASFRGLMQFLDGLRDLPFIAAPVACNIQVRVERHPKTRLPVRQWLEVQIKFAV